MSTFDDLVSARTSLGGADLLHLERLVRTWRPLADLSFSDLLLQVPIVGEDAHRFVVLAQIRSTTGQTIYVTDMVGTVVDEVERPLLRRAWEQREILVTEGTALRSTERANLQCIPVPRGDGLVGLLTREEWPEPLRRHGRMEQAYRDAFERFAQMIAQGAFPYGRDDVELEGSPRVSDGVVVLDPDARITFASPNAVSSLHRMGIHAYTTGSRLREVGFDDRVVRAALSTKLPVGEELERGEVTVSTRVLPIVASGAVEGAVMLMRDVTDLRRRDRMLISKDMTIREIHHRVKNNLQTIASLLRIHARRLDSEEARAALAESERRIRSIAIVHETLAQDAGDAVALAEVIRPLTQVVRETLVTPGREVEFSVEGVAGDVPGEVATPLAVVLNELMQNAVDHAFDATTDGVLHVSIHLDRSGDDVIVVVRDDGRGVPQDFDVARAKGLGLSIVEALVTDELGGSIDIRGGKGTTVTIRVPVGIERVDVSRASSRSVVIGPAV